MKAHPAQAQDLDQVMDRLDPAVVNVQLVK